MVMKIRLVVVFRMGGVSYRGYHWEDGAVVFEFERLGNAFIQVMSERVVEEEITHEPSAVFVELRTKEGGKVFEAVKEGDAYLAEER